MAGSKPPRLSRRVAFALLASLSFFANGPIGAHPHAWIDLETTPRIDRDHGLHAIEQRWVLDPSYSVVLLEDQLATQGDSDFDTALASLAERLHERLAEQAHLTEVRRGGEPVAGTVAATWVELVGRRLVVAFVWRPDEPPPSAAADGGSPADWSYRVYDPEYWIEILHHAPPEWQWIDGQGAAVGDATMNCAVALDAAQPDPRWVVYASQLDRTESPARTDDGGTLGRLFSERVRIECAAPRGGRDAERAVESDLHSN